ncbi:alpha/beta hydrolase family protein [Roseateles sp. LYH14W]|uniref:Alpha/beta hydrolase family protein n=1 Tax=Pelomonas parva TaxID=3299032 RepID=A0ABW7F5R9_9BURK
MRYLSLLLSLCLAASAQAAEIGAFAPGPHAVGSTNLQVTPPTSRPLIDYLNGSKDGAYLSAILTHPQAVPQLQIIVPASQPGAGAIAGKPQPLVLHILYPTPASNARPDYAFPYKDTGDALVPHMQGPTDKPLLADPAARYPLIVYSGGYNTHGLWHLGHLKGLASHGYIVVNLFHGDGRAPGYHESVALRQAGVRAALDHVLKDPVLGPAIDRDRIGASGSSAGGMTVLALLGGVDPKHPAHNPRDPRIKAGFGLVPFMGTSFGVWPFATDAWHLGREFEGLAAVKAPFFAVYADQDKSVAPDAVRAGVRRLGGPAWAVELPSEGHLLSPAAEREAYSWELAFFDAVLRGNAEARAKLVASTQVSGGSKGKMAFTSAGR